MLIRETHLCAFNLYIPDNKTNEIGNVWVMSLRLSVRNVYGLEQSSLIDVIIDKIHSH